MNTEIVKTNGLQIPEDALKKAAEILQNGGLVVFPTETVYGLGGNGTDAEAAKKIYAAKGRPSDNPLIIHIASPEEAEEYAVTSPAYYKLAKAFKVHTLFVKGSNNGCGSSLKNNLLHKTSSNGFTNKKGSQFIKRLPLKHQNMKLKDSTPHYCDNRADII